jgi:hypothetical protein
MVSIVLVALSTLFTGVALGISILSYLARNRPYVGVKKLSVSGYDGGLTQELSIEVENVGDIPATDVVAYVTDSASLIEIAESGIPLGVIFPHQSISFNLSVPLGFAYAPDKEKSYFEDLGDGVQRYHDVYPEGDGVIVNCDIRCRQLVAFGWHLWTYRTQQPLHLAPDGQWRPSISELASIN